MKYLQVNALSEWIIGIYLHEFTNNERENSIPHEAAEWGIENFEFIVSKPSTSTLEASLLGQIFVLRTSNFRGATISR